MDLNNKTIAVTGAGRGIGHGIAIALAQQGANIAVLDINAEDAATSAAACEKQGIKANAYVCNVADEESVEACFANIRKDFDALHGLVNNAGIARDATLVKTKDGQVVGKMSLAQWQSVIDVNLTGTFLCAREAAALMIESQVEEGAIVNISSVARAGNYGLSNYSASKAGVATLAEVWAKELARYNIRTGVVAPGIIDTDLLAATQPAARERWISGIPLKRLGDTSHIADAVRFIFENSYFTGRVVEIDGGLR
ncbi:MAG: SDR family oxidoreductase [Pseudomonadales bacterium]|nr:SDR family oxidoreductase [Pseudomonadales bacterium]